jgi:hypothetical protein
MSQTGTYQNTNETIEKERIEQLILDFLFFIEALHYEVRQGKAYQPA